MIFVQPDRAGPLQRASILLALTAVYFLAGKLGLGLAVVHPSATLVWPPAGIALAACLILGVWVWPAVFVAAFLVSLTPEGTLATSLAIAFGNTLEAVMGAYLVNRFANGSRSFESVRDLSFYLVLAVGLSPTVAATIGVTALALGGLADWTSYGPIWLTWWAGDGGGALIVAPVVLLWVYPPSMHWTRARILEAGAVGAATALAGIAVFGGVLPFSIEHYPLDFVCVPFLGWAALRLSPRVAATEMLFLSAVAIWGTINGYGPFAGESTHSALWLLQAFTAVTAVGTLLFAAAVTERRALIQRLQDLSMSDPLTGLANYRRLIGVLENEIVRSQRTERPFAVVLLDLDGLKSLNDRYGHLTGSRALCRLADALRDTCRAVDTPARYGGDEFALVLPETDRSAAIAVTERIRRRLLLETERPPITASAGCAVHPDDGKTAESLIGFADKELYQVKATREVARY